MKEDNTSNNNYFVDVTKENLYSKIAEIPLPKGFYRVAAPAGSFAEWLRNLPLKKDRHVYLYNGNLKPYQDAQYAVINISTGKTDLQQCADAVMRLRAEYFYSRKECGQIAFADNDNRIYQCPANAARVDFDKYLNKVFAACGSYSLEHQLKQVNNFSSIAIGDVIVKGGFPGHAVIVVDVAENNKGEKVYLLAQSYMPAQDIHLLQNFTNTAQSPWYSTNTGNSIATPQWVFYKNQLKRW